MMMGLASYAQTAQSTTVDFNKTKVPGVSIAITGYDFNFIQAALQNRFEKVGKLKGSNSKGFRVYLAQAFPEFGTLTYDIYTQVIKPSKKNPSVTVHLLVSKGNENFISPAADPDLTQTIRDFLTNFIPYLSDYDKAQKVGALTDNINKFEKDLKSLRSDRDKLKKDISKLEGKLKDKEKSITSKENELQKAKAALDALKND